MQQSKLFIEKARQLGANEEKSAADELLEMPAKLPSQPDDASKTKRRT